MVKLMVMLFWVDHGRPWFDHGQIVISWSNCHFMVSSRSCCSGLTMVKLMVISWSVQGHVFWFDHGQIDGHFMVSGRSCCPRLTMVDHGQIKVMLFWVDHG